MTNKMSLGGRNYEILGYLLSLSTTYHNLLVMALSKLLDVHPLESQAVFAPRSTGDLSTTLKALLKLRSGVGEEIPLDEVLQEMSRINLLMSRTNHVHGAVLRHRPSHYKKPTGDEGVTFLRPDISGGKLKMVRKRYDTSSEFANAALEIEISIWKLQDLLEITDAEIRKYWDTRFFR